MLLPGTYSPLAGPSRRTKLPWKRTHRRWLALIPPSCTPWRKRQLGSVRRRRWWRRGQAGPQVAQGLEHRKASGRRGVLSRRQGSSFARRRSWRAACANSGRGGTLRGAADVTASGCCSYGGGSDGPDTRSLNGSRSSWSSAGGRSRAGADGILVASLGRWRCRGWGGGDDGGGSAGAARRTDHGQVRGPKLSCDAASQSGKRGRDGNRIWTTFRWPVGRA